MRQVIVYPGEDGYWECPSLPGCISQGSSRNQAIEKAIHEYVTALDEDYLPVPPERYEAVLVEV